jgi:hypothetical protein
MKQLWFLAVIAVGAFSCADEGSPLEGESVESNESELGDLTLNLTGYDTQGRQYRLREAQFVVSNYQYDDCYYFGCDAGTNVAKVLSTEVDPNAATLTTTLVPGSYRVDLLDNWYIERLTSNGPERIERAVLLSERLQYAWIFHGGASYLAYRFGVDGELIDFRHGDLVIGSEFELPGDSQPDAGWGPVPAGDAGRIDAGVSAN